MSNIIDNLERIGHKQAGDVTTIPSYTPDQEVGPQTDFARDFNQESGEVGPLTNHDVKSNLPFGEVDNASSPNDLGGAKNTTKGDYNDPTWIRESPASSFTTGQYSVPTQGAVQVAQSKTDRRSVVIMNVDPTYFCYIGPNSAVNTTSGFVLVPGGAITLATGAEVWAISGGSAVVITTIEYMGISQ